MKNIEYQESYNEHHLKDGNIYDIGMNDGTVFKGVEYLGTKLHNGKPMMCFVTKSELKQITINPSYHSWTIEKENLNGEINSK